MDVQPSHVNFAEVPFCQECQQTFTVTNVSDVATTIQLRCPKESIAFISKIGDKDIAFGDNCVWEFGLKGN